MEERVDFHCNAFVEFCIQANEEEKRWLNKVFGNKRAKTRSYFIYEKMFDAVRFRIAHGDRMCYVNRRRAEKDLYDVISRYPWTQRDDHSASRLTRDVLVRIYSHLKDPDDMWSFMRTNRRFYQAGCFYTGYTTKIDRLFACSGVDHLPFRYIQDERRRFFALCFVSDRKDVETILVRMIIQSNLNSDLFDYCFNMSGLNLGVKHRIHIYQTNSLVIEHYDARSVIIHSRTGFLGWGQKDSKFGIIRNAIKRALL